MTVAIADIKHRRSAVVTDTPTNGGRLGTTVIVTARNNILPRVTQAERTAGITRYRKTFLLNHNAANEVANDFLFYFIINSTSDDRIYFGMGHNNDTQASWVASGAEYPHWQSAGQLDSDITAGASSVDIVMENNDIELPPGGYLYISDKFMTGQTIAGDVSMGNSVELVGGTWVRRDYVDDVEYPYGYYMGSNTVYTSNTGMNEEYPRIAEDKTTDEVLGTGNGTTTPTVADFGNVTNGLNFKGVYVDSRQGGWLAMKPRLGITVGGTPTTLYFDADGYLQGATAGRINMDTGVWITAPTFTSAPDGGTDITATYWDKPYSFAGNVMTVNLADTVANNYTAANSFAGGCINVSELKAMSRDWSETSASGTYDEATYPVVTEAYGTIYDSWTIEFTSSTAFTCTGTNTGSVGTGTISSDFGPVNPDTSTPYFTIDMLGWGGSWTTGDQVTFVTEPAALGVVWKEVVPAATAAYSNNLVIFGLYWE